MVVVNSQDTLNLIFISHTSVDNCIFSTLRAFSFQLRTDRILDGMKEWSPRATQLDCITAFIYPPGRDV